MKTNWIRPWLSVVLAIAAAVVWSFVLVMAAHVSQILLNTLDMIVDLAQMS